MSDPSDALQAALVTALKAAQIAAGRIYDTVPTNPVFPYVQIGDDQVIGDDVECAEISAITTRIHVWSRAIGFPECKEICGAVRSALRATPLVLAGFTVAETRFEQTQYLRDPDGLTRHGVIEFTVTVTHDP